MKIEDLLGAGTRIDIGSHTFEADEIKRFASKFDPQRFHLDEEEARKSVFGKLCASGWHTASMWMRYNILYGPERITREELERQTIVPGPSPGIRNLKWLRPVYVGDTITFHRTPLNCRAVSDRPGWHLAKLHCGAVNQEGVSVMEFDSAYLLTTA